MNQIEYRAARSLWRSNRAKAYRLMSEDQLAVFERLRTQRRDAYAVIAFCFCHTNFAPTIADRMAYRHRAIHDITTESRPALSWSL